MGRPACGPLPADSGESLQFEASLDYKDAVSKKPTQSINTSWVICTEEARVCLGMGRGLELGSQNCSSSCGGWSCVQEEVELTPPGDFLCGGALCLQSSLGEGRGPQDLELS